jgi:T5SS/PEP-CTERM-associated repeat protein
MARGCAEMATLALGLALAASPVRAEIELGTAGYRAFVQVSHDQNGDGVYDPDEDTTFDEADVNPAALPIGESWQVALGPSSASANATVTVSQQGGTLRFTSTGSCAGAHQSGPIEGANSRVEFGVLFSVTGPAQYSATGTLTASAGASVSGVGYRAENGTTLVETTETIVPGTNYVVGVDCWAFGGEGLATFSGSWNIEVTVTEGDGSCEPETVSWVGGRAGDFDVAENWDPPRVPLLDEAAGRCDEILIRGGRGLVLDLDGSAAPALALAAGAAPTPIKRTPRFTVDAHRELQPVDGTVEGVDTSPVAGERSVEVINGGSLLLNGGGVFARHLGVGSSGDGLIEVVSPRGYLETTGRLGLGIRGSGSLLVRDGATVIAAEAVLGETNAQGSITVQGNASTLDTGNIAVGLEDDGTLLIEGGGQVTSDTAVIDFNLDGDERGRATVRGRDAAGNRSTWQPDALDVGPRGSLAIEAGALVEVAGALRIGFEGAAADCSTGRACVRIDDGAILTDALAVGSEGGGELRIGPGGRFGVLGPTVPSVIGADSATGRVIVEGPNPIVSNFYGIDIAVAAGSAGELELRNGAEVSLNGPLRVGIAGGAGLVRLSTGSTLDHDSDAVFGEPSATPHDQRTYTAELELLNGTFDSDSEFLIEGTGSLTSDGGRVVIAAPAQLKNRGLIRGNLQVVGDYVEGTTGAVEGTVLEAPPASPAQQLRSSSSLLLAPLAAAPPPPAFGPLVVTGNATLAGLAKLQFGNGVAPQQGQQFELLQVQGTVTGAFDEVEIAGLAPGAAFASEIVNGALVLTSLTDAEPLPYVNLAGKPLLLESKKAAKLKLTRSGDTTASLTVAYTVGGTAESGVDFVALPGTIQFPARKKSVTLLVQPIADGFAEGSETIEITLAPDASFAPGLASELTLELRDGKAK